MPWNRSLKQNPEGKIGKPTTQPMMSEAQKRAIYNLSRRRGISVEQLEQMVADAYGCDLETLTSKRCISVHPTIAASSLTYTNQDVNLNLY